ncbi:hypothetical protein [Streptomyces sp. NPDC018693]|uniref:hypothetical protein n=1 Tax=unclassified Streptomyces TaxID=2593676 RepID=UPI0037A22402
MSLAFRDPPHGGATDPTVIRHRTTGEWWMYYTQRRAGLHRAGVEWVHGTDIGTVRGRPLTVDRPQHTDDHHLSTAHHPPSTTGQPAPRSRQKPR